MKKKLWIIIVAVLLLVLVGGYFGYNIYYVNYYDLSHLENYEKYKENFHIKDETFTITTTTLTEEEYFTYKNMKMRNIFDGYESKFDSDEFEHPHEEDSIWYVLNDKETGKSIGAIGMGRDNTQLELLKSGFVVMSEESRVGEIKNINKFLEKNNITNDIELLKFLEKTLNKKHSIFDSVDDMKTLYALHLQNYIGNMNNEGITLIDGDYEGYIINHNMGGANIIECDILKDSKRYVLTFNNASYYTNEMIKDLLNTLVIE